LRKGFFNMMRRFQGRDLLILGGCIVLLLLLGVLDYYTGYEVHFFVFYFIPIALLAWFEGRIAALFMAVASALTWCTADILSQHNYPSLMVFYWNSSIRFFTFVLAAILISKIRRDLDHERELNDALSRALSQVKQLSGLLPVCASCKRIRNDKGYWEQIEVYVRDHSEADFSHGICPDCLKKLYPEYHEQNPAGFPVAQDVPPKP